MLGCTSQNPVSKYVNPTYLYCCSRSVYQHHIVSHLLVIPERPISCQVANWFCLGWQENNEALRKALEVKRAELAMAKAAARQNSPPAEPAPAEDTLADKVAVMEQKARSLAEQLHSKVWFDNGSCMHLVSPSAVPAAVVLVHFGNAVSSAASSDAYSPAEHIQHSDCHV